MQLGRAQIYQWALTNSKIGSFCYYDSQRYRCNSSNFVVTVVSAFMRSCGYYMPDAYIGSSDDQGRAAFRNALALQIHTLTSRKPRIEEEYDNAAGKKRYCMWAS